MTLALGTMTGVEAGLWRVREQHLRGGERRDNMCWWPTKGLRNKRVLVQAASVCQRTRTGSLLSTFPALRPR